MAGDPASTEHPHAFEALIERDTKLPQRQVLRTVRFMALARLALALALALVLVAAHRAAKKILDICDLGDKFGHITTLTTAAMANT